MYENYIKLIYRQIVKNKFFSLLTFSGLAIGMTSFLLLTQYVKYEFDYDNFHQNINTICRIQLNSYDGKELNFSMAQTPPMLGPTLKKQFPEVKEFLRIRRAEEKTFIYNQKKLKAMRILADSTFFTVFSFKLLEGSEKKVLVNPNSIVISENIAKKLFHEEDPIGKTIKLDNTNKVYSVTGIFEDIPNNSHLEFDIILPLNTNWNSWQDFNFNTYVLFQNEGDYQNLQKKMPQFIKNFVVWDSSTDGLEFIMQPLKSIHLHSELLYDTKNGDIKTIKFLFVISIIILLISLINYINLTTARSLERAKEVGVRKVLGSYKAFLIKQFLFESLILNAIPVILSIFFVFILYPYFNILTGKEFDIYTFNNYWFFISVVFLFALGSLLTGIYPAFVQSSFKPVTMLKKVKLSNSKAGTIFKRGLLASQFFSSIILIVFTIVIFKQIKLMKEQDKGIDIKNIIAVQLPNLQLKDSVSIQNNENFKNELNKYSDIKKISSSSTIPGKNPVFRAGIWRKNDIPENSKMQALITIDYDFFELYNINPIAGRSFSKEFGSDFNAIIINESSLKFLNFESANDAINQVINIYGEDTEFKIIGVVKNFNQESLKKSIEPIVFLLSNKINKYFSIKINKNNQQNAISIISNKWEQTFEGESFDYIFIDDHFNSLYKEDLKFGKVIGTFSILAIIITCIGILGLSLYNIIQKTKEIGVRKVLGADIKNILYVLIKEYIGIIAIVTLVSWPVSYFLINKWLQNYAYRTSIPFWIILFAGFIVLIITVSTVFYHTYKAAKKNPVIALKYE